MSKELIILITFIAYLGMMLGIGAYFYKKTSNLSDYVLGGRQLGKWVTSMSAQASDMSGWLLMGLPGAAYMVGLSGSIWMAIGLAIGTYLNWKIIAKRLRVATEKYGNAITLSSYFENRFEDKSHFLKIISSLFILVFFLIYTASGFVASGKLFNSVFGIDYKWAVLIGAVVVVGYTFMGGFMAVCWTDLIQGVLMFIALIVLPCMVIIDAGGIGAVAQTVDPSMLDAFRIEVLVSSDAPQNALMAGIGILSSLAWGLGYFGQPHILTRFMAIKDPEEVKRSRRIAMGWVIISLFAATVIGLIGHVAFADLTKVGSENIFILLVDKYVPVFIAGIFLSAVLAAIMSTADSQLLVTASAMSEDLYKGKLKPKASDKELVWVGRLTVVAVAVIAAIIALNPESSVLDLVAWAWAGFGAAFGPVILISLFWKKMTKEGAIAGMLVGGLVAFVWPMLRTQFPSAWVFYIYELLPGFIMASLCIWGVSKCSNKKSPN
ncbi:MAG: sodium/proline symporter PutP [Cellulosilyticaceae bacterium]